MNFLSCWKLGLDDRIFLKFFHVKRGEKSVRKQETKKQEINYYSRITVMIIYTNITKK